MQVTEHPIEKMNDDLEDIQATVDRCIEIVDRMSAKQAEIRKWRLIREGMQRVGVPCETCGQIVHKAEEGI